MTSKGNIYSTDVHQVTFTHTTTTLQMAGFSSYKAGYDDFQKRNTIHKDMMTFFTRNRTEFEFPEAKSCVSYGPGCGSIDKQYITNFLPGLKKYYGVEPDAKQMETLRKTMNNLETSTGQVECEFIQLGAEEYEGPEEPVDIILMINMLYHVKDIFGFLQKQKVSPQGVIIISCTEPNDTQDNLANYIKMDRNTEVIKRVGDIINAVGFTEVKNL